MAAGRVRFYGHGDARVVAPEASQNNTAGGKAASQEEGGLRGPAAGVQGRGPPLSLQVVVLVRALLGADASRNIVTVLGLVGLPTPRRRRGGASRASRARYASAGYSSGRLPSRRGAAARSHTARPAHFALGGHFQTECRRAVLVTARTSRARTPRDSASVRRHATRSDRATNRTPGAPRRVLQASRLGCPLSEMAAKNGKGSRARARRHRTTPSVARRGSPPHRRHA